MEAVLKNAGESLEINRADEKEIAALPGVGMDLALEMLRRRPFKSWEQLETALNLPPDLIERMKRAGAHIQGQ